MFESERQPPPDGASNSSVRRITPTRATLPAEYRIERGQRYPSQNPSRAHQPPTVESVLQSDNEYSQYYYPTNQTEIFVHPEQQIDYNTPRDSQPPSALLHDVVLQQSVGISSG